MKRQSIEADEALSRFEGCSFLLNDQTISRTLRPTTENFDIGENAKDIGDRTSKFLQNYRNEKEDPI